METTMRDRIEAKGRILFAAAQADGHIEAPEVDRILAVLEKDWDAAGLGDALPTDFMDALSAFDAQGTSMADLARPFRDESESARRALLEEVVLVHSADGELDYQEDTFVRELGLALGLAEAQFSDLLLEIFEATPGTEPGPAAPARTKTKTKTKAKPKPKKASKAKAKAPARKPAGARPKAKKKAKKR